jgi:hypothetical protein
MKKLNIYKQILLIGIFVYLAIGGYSQTIISRTVNLDYPEVEFQLLNNGVQVQEDAFLYIDDTPAMPNLVGRFISDNNTLQVEANISVQFIKYYNNVVAQGVVRTRTTPFPFRTMSWAIFLSNNENTFVFYIRGNNPEENVVQTLLSELSNDGIWFLNRLVREESQYEQFNDGGAPSTDWTSSDDCPNWGYPNGWGLMQLDPPGLENNLWNWRENVTNGYNFLNGEKRNIALGGWNQHIGAYNTDRALDASLTNSGETHTTIINGDNETFDFDLEPGVGEYSLFDACWIKAYNGVSGDIPIPGENRVYTGYYYIWRNQGDDAENPRWVINNTNSNDRDYVSDVLNERN